MDLQIIVEQWYDNYRKEKNLAKDQPVSPFELLYFLAEKKECQYVPAFKVDIIINDTIRRLSILRESPDKDLFIEIFGSTDRWHLFVQGHHYNVLTFLTDLDEDERSEFIRYIQEKVMNKINSL